MEIEQFVVRPSFEDYQTEIQPMLVALGCSVGAGCHLTDFRGEVRIVAEPTPEQIYRDYQSIKALTNLNEPAQSVLLVRLLEGAAGATHQPLCFNSTGDCGYQKLLAWIAWDGEGQRPQEINCSYEAEGCY